MYAKGGDLVNIGQRIKKRRKQLGISVDDMTTRLNKNRSTLFRYESGEIENLPLDIVKPIADILQTTPEWLMGWEEVQKNNDIIADIVVKMRTDEEFLSVVDSISKLDSEKLIAIKTMVSALLK